MNIISCCALGRAGLMAEFYCWIRHYKEEFSHVLYEAFRSIPSFASLSKSGAAKALIMVVVSTIT